jgi:uncharacterized protein (TIGR02246 family)
MNQQQVQSTTATDQIAALYQQLMDGWNEGSGEAFAAPFAEDADFIAFDGTYMRGRQAIADQHQYLFDHFVKGTRLIGKVRNIRFLSPTIALMHTVGGTVMAGQTDLEPERNSVQTMVAVQENGEWRLAAFHNCRAQFMGRPDEAQKLTEELRQLL